MKTKLTFLTTLLISFAALANPYKWQVVRITDGDTVVVATPWILPELGQTMAIRIVGIDTPEKGSRAKCQQEANLAYKASMLTMSMVKPGDTVAVYVKDWDKYGGRLLGTIITSDGRDIASVLIENGVARPYGGGTKQSWCH